jgi:DNA-binding response OmpR family regulator
MSEGRLHVQRSPVAATRPLILIVDGDPDTRSLYRAIFPPEHYAIEVADDGAEALGKAICWCPDLIIMEAQIPRIDGFELCRLLRADAMTRAVRIVMVTAAAQPADRIRAKTAGADAIIVKPCNCEEVVAVARQVLDQPRPEQAAPHLLQTRPRRLQ